MEKGQHAIHAAHMPATSKNARDQAAGYHVTAVPSQIEPNNTEILKKFCGDGKHADYPAMLKKFYDDEINYLVS